ncbi:MAG: leucyl aminopeptidase [Candidatus Bathyarchaeia archaeon]
MLRIDSKPFPEIKSDILAINIFDDEPPLPKDLADLDGAMSGLLNEALSDTTSSRNLYEVTSLFRPRGLLVKRLLLIGSGSKHDFNFEIATRIASFVARQVRSVSEIAFFMRGELSAERRGQACIEGALLGTLEMGKYKTGNSKSILESIIILSSTPAEEGEIRRGAERGRIYAEATNYARDLVNEPSNILTPKRFAEKAIALAKEHGMQVDVLGPDRMIESGLNAILGVGKASNEPPQLCVLKYEGADSQSPTVAIIGKGITFDSGGISLKEPDGMHYMKFDMSGGAAILGAMKIIGTLRPKINVLGIVAVAENMPGGGAQKPGDVVRAFNKKTIEILSTDAEGRLVLADAISYARHLGASYLVDIATLTGACIVALGEITTGVMTNDENWAAQVLEAAKYAGEKMWLLPTFPEYRDLIESEIADMTNSANRKVAHGSAKPAGAIVGAMLLREFAENTPWAHLDIAGTAWNSRKGYLAVGPTGVGVRTLAQLILSMNVTAS